MKLRLLNVSVTPSSMKFTLPIIFALRINFVFAQCPSPEVPENGRLIADPMPNTTTINYECDPGFILVGAEKRSCQLNGVWSGTTPICAYNVALHKPAIQSSTLIDDPKAYHANYSTDGNFEGTCSSTVEEKVSWWQVDLLEIHRILAVELMIPSGVGRDQNIVQKIHILTSTTDDFSAKSKTASLCYKHDGTLESNRLHTFICIKETKARYVRIVARNAPVHLCEVVVLSSSVGNNQSKSGTCDVTNKSYRCFATVLPLTYKSFQWPPTAYQVLLTLVGNQKSHNLEECKVKSVSFSASEWQCPSLKSLQLWGVYDRKCYYGSFETAPWFVAKSKCSEIGTEASLAVDVDLNLQQFFVSQIRTRFAQPPQFYWIGVSNVNDEWRWINGKTLKTNFWAEASSKDVSLSSFSYGATLAEPYQWNWMPSLQAIWYNWICQSPLKFCSSPGVPTNGGIMTSGQMRTIGSTIFYYCNNGYTISGDKNRVCQENGIWSSVAPTCAPVDCGRPDVLFDLSITFLNETKTTLGSVVEYECPRGQKLIGSQTRICQPDSKWSGKPPQCDDVDCDYPERLDHGKVILVKNSTIVGNIAEYSCDAGFGLTGAAVRHCSSSGVWIPSQVPICTDLNTLQSALGPNNFNKHQTSLMTGFIVAIIILLIVLFLVVFWIWKKKKLYDTFSMSTLYGTNSQLNVSVGVGGGQDVLYAFPSTVTTAISANVSLKGSSHYYPTSDSSSTHHHYGPSIIQMGYCGDEINNRRNVEKSDSIRSANDVRPMSVVVKESPSMNVDEMNLNVADINNRSYYISDSIKRREIERVMKDIQLTLPSTSDEKLDTNTAQRQAKQPNLNFTWKNSNIVEYVRQKWSTDVAPRVNTLRSKIPQHFHISSTTKPNETSADQKRPSSPTLSELFSFDDDDDVGEADDENGVVEEIYSVVSELRAIQNASAIVPSIITVNPCCDAVDKDADSSLKRSGDKIYDVPPDAAFRTNRNLARVLTKKGKEEKIYDTPCDVVATNNVVVETVHTYC